MVILQNQQVGTNGEWGVEIEGKAIQTILEAKPHQQTIPQPRDSVDTMGMGRSPTGGRTPIDRMARFGYAVHSELW